MIFYSEIGLGNIIAKLIANENIIIEMPAKKTKSSSDIQIRGTEGLVVYANATIRYPEILSLVTSAKRKV